MPVTLIRLIGNAFSHAFTAVFGKSSEDPSLQPPPKKKSRKTKDYADPYLFANNYHTVIKKPITEVYEQVIPNDIVSSSELA